ncbi:hydroxymethylglutaryl-CoA lyase [Virgibacillus byunsanensis]|uniref:Hydroxymethylglutaryl-CoA lyase n=1 Tax=Virgibacillus byunsanensis TaxID=570945 RepID=A0ABW3LM66_9BACI
MITICEVGPRDGIQNVKKLLLLEEKLELINRLIDSGIELIEAVSFVNPKVIPQMADTEELMKLVPRTETVKYAGLVLSQSGLNRALEANVDFLHVVLATSDTFNQKNVKRSVKESITELTPVIKGGTESGKVVNGVLGTAFGCPFDGNIPERKILKTAEEFLNAGAKKITLADTTGLADPGQVQSISKAFYKQFGKEVELGLHFHNTRGLGIANVLAGYQEGVRQFDTSIGGLGGCPFAPKAAGNVCTEDVVNMFEQMGEEIGINKGKLIDTSKWLEDVVGLKVDGMLMKT